MNASALPCLVQTSDPVRYLTIFDITSQSSRRFCTRHRLSFEPYIGVKRGDRPWHATFNRIPLLYDLMQKGHREWVLYLDADAYVYDVGFDINSYLFANRDWSIIGAPGGDRPWQPNAGILFLNYAQPRALELIAEWWRVFEQELPESRLLGMSDWPPGVPDDQALLHGVLYRRSDFAELLKLEPLSFIGAPTSSFVRQVLRTYGDLDARSKAAWVDVSGALARDAALCKSESATDRDGAP